MIAIVRRCHMSSQARKQEKMLIVASVKLKKIMVHNN